VVHLRRGAALCDWRQMAPRGAGSAPRLGERPLGHIRIMSRALPTDARRSARRGPGLAGGGWAASFGLLLPWPVSGWRGAAITRGLLLELDRRFDGEPPAMKSVFGFETLPYSGGILARNESHARFALFPWGW
jgi:hypothetical protein